MKKVYTLFFVLCIGSYTILGHTRKMPDTEKKPSISPTVTSITNAPLSAPHAVQLLTIAYLAQTHPVTRPDPTVDAIGIQGAQIALEENNTTGHFTGQSFRLHEVILPHEGDTVAAFMSLIKEGYQHILLNLSAKQITELAALPESQSVLLYNIARSEDALRTVPCYSHVLHLLPSHAMRADALAQYLSKKKWTRWFLVVGTHPEDVLYAQALRRAAKKFGLYIVMEKVWNYRFDERRTPESEVPVFTQGEEYDVIVIADEQRLFGDIFPYRTWKPRPVVGSVGLIATAWHPTHELWGALQLQHRFYKKVGRWMREEEYGAWLAVRAIGEAATRTQSVTLDRIKAFLLSDAFTLAAFKGVPLSFRSWDHQLRQPVLLAADKSLVAVTPVEGYLHPKSELDTLGIDQPESACH